MDLYKDLQSLKLDEIRDLIVNLSSDNNAQNTTLVNAITSNLSTAIANLKNSLLTTQNTTLEAEIKNKIIDVYTALSSSISALATTINSDSDTISAISSTLTTLASNITTLANAVNGDTTTINGISSSVSTILSNISTLSTQIANKECGLTTTQSQTLTNTYNNTTQILSNLSNASGGGGQVDLSSITTALNVIELNLEEILDKLELPSQELQPTAPYDPPPQTIYKSRDTYISEYYYDITQPRDLDAEYFTINDDINAMVKVEFDITTTNTINDIEVKLHLSDIDILCDKHISVTSGTTHFCLYGAFLTERTDYYLMLNFTCGELKTFRVQNIEYEVIGDNANFLSYMHKFYTYNCNYDNYIFKVENGAVSYFTTNVLNPNYGQNFTTLTSGNNYLYVPVIATTYTNNGDGSSFIGIRVLRQDKNTHAISGIKDDGTSVGIENFAVAEGFRIFNTMPTNASSYAVTVHRYDAKTKELRISYFYSGASAITAHDTQNLQSLDAIVAITQCVHTLSYNKYYYKLPLCVITTAKGQNYISGAYAVNQNTNLGYGTRVKLGGIPNYQGTVNSTLDVNVVRVFMYVYDHWKVMYIKCDNYRNFRNFQILGTKVLNGDYDEVHPGFNGEYFTVKNGQIVCHDDVDVVKTVFN